MNAKTKGTVATEIAAETKNANPSNPAETPKENAVAAKTGAVVCARPAIAQATPSAPPCAFSGVFVEIKVFKVTIWIPKPNERPPQLLTEQQDWAKRQSHKPNNQKNNSKQGKV